MFVNIMDVVAVDCTDVYAHNFKFLTVKARILFPPLLMSVRLAVNDNPRDTDVMVV